jgi:hypothetical protein
MSDAKTVDAETRMQADDLAKAEASVLIISISTKTRIGLSLLFSNKNLYPARIFFPARDPSPAGISLTTKHPAAQSVKKPQFSLGKGTPGLPATKPVNSAGRSSHIVL